MTTKRLEDLDVAEVTTWLVSIRLNNAFGDEFAEQQIDGECLMGAEASDFDRAGGWVNGCVTQAHPNIAPPRTCICTRLQTL